MDNSSPEHKEILKFTISAKDGNRIGRRLRRGLGDIGDITRGRGSSGLSKEPYDPNAFDGDGDGMVQDGSNFERPVVFRSQSLPTTPPDATAAIGTDKKPLTERVRAETRRQVGLASETPRDEKDEILPDVARVAKSKIPPDPRNPEWLATATPRELAEAFVPKTLKENDELNERLRVPRELYATEEEYQRALKLHRDSNSSIRRLTEQKLDGMKQIYDNQYGVGAFDGDISYNSTQFNKRVTELFGNQELFGAAMVPGSPQLVSAQFQWLTRMAGNINLPQNLRRMLNDTVTAMQLNNGALTHGAFLKVDENKNFTPVVISPIEFLIANLLTGDGSQPIIAETLQPFTLNSPDALKLSQLLLENYFRFIQRSAGQNFITDAQIKNRMDLITKANSVHSLFGTIFPNRWMDNYALRNFVSNSLPSDNEQDREMLRAMVQRTLQDNPEFLATVRKFGLPVLNVSHRVFNWVNLDDVPREMVVGQPKDFNRQTLKRRRELGRKLLKKLDTLLQAEAGRAGRPDGIQFSEPVFGAAGHFDAYVGLGGTYNPATGDVFLTLPMFLTQMMAPSKADEGIIPISSTQAISEIVGESAVFVHEYGHYVDYLLRNNLFQLKWEKVKRSLGDNPSPEELKSATALFRSSLLNHPAFGKNGKWIHDPMNSQRARIELFGGAKPSRITPDEITKGHQLFDVVNLSNDELNTQITELTAQLLEIHGAQSLMIARQQMQGMRRAQRQQMGVSPSAVGDLSRTHPEPYVVTPYGQTNTQERFAEIFAATVTRIGQKHPVLVNNAAVRMMSRIVGLKTEPQDVTRLRRRKEVDAKRGVYSDETEDISNRIISDIKLIAPNVERQSDGHRPGLTSSTSSANLRFDPNERSRLLSNSNLDIDTDERLYATETPTSITDYGSRARMLKIGDHHFYDRDIPYASFLNRQMRQSLGNSAGRRFVNRNRPHQGDMVRAISATQFGLFVDDMPTYDTTSTSQIETLKGLVTGKITKLRPLQRSQIEEAFKDATNIHSAIQTSEPTKRDIFRIIKVDRETFLNGLNVGDSIPMPITAFTSSVPSGNNPVVVRLTKGAKAINVNNSQFLTQGNFEVSKIDDDGTNIVATLTHKEVFDPRHNAMRPVDMFSDVPGKMRKMGTAFPRYTPIEQEKMEIDLAKRKDRAEVLKARGLSSSTSTRSQDEKYKDLSDEEVTEFLEFEQGLRKDYKEQVEPIFAKLRDIVSTHIKDTVNRRLTATIKAVKDKYGTDRPWADDSDIIRKWRGLDEDTVNQSTKFLIDILRSKGRFGRLMTVEGKFLTDNEVNRRVNRMYTSTFADTSMDLSASQIEHLLRTGQYVFWPKGDEAPDVDAPTVSIPGLLNPQTPEFKQLRQVLEVTLETLEAIQRAYLLDGTAGSREINFSDRDTVFQPTQLAGRIIFKDRQLEIKPRNKGGYAVLGSSGRYGDGALSFVMEATFALDSQEHRVGDYFRRDAFLDKDGNIKVRHESFFVRGNKNDGIATLLNQHAALWWRQHENTEIFLPNPAIDGIIVWPRLNYQFDINDPYSDDARGNFKSVRRTFINNIRSLLRENSGLPVEGLDVVSSGSDDKYGIKNNPDFRRRLVGWLVLARVQESKGLVDPGLLTILANIIEPRELSRDQANQWKQLFDDSNITSAGLTMNFSENLDNDWLPSFVIPDAENDSFIPDTQNRQRAEIIQEITADKDAEFDLFIAGLDENVKLSSEQAGRLEAIFGAKSSNFDEIRMFRSASRARYAREAAAFNSPPQLITEIELNERMTAGREIYYAVSQSSVGTIGTANELLLTTEPFRLINKMVDTLKPEQDPAQNPNGVLVFLDPNAKIASSGTLRKIIAEIFPNPYQNPEEAPDLLIEKIFNRYSLEEEEIEYLGRTIRILRLPNSITENNASQTQQMAYRLVKTVIDIHNQAQMQGPESKLQKLRDDLLGEIVGSGSYFNNLIPILLGFDAVRNRGNQIEILNNQTIQVFDEKVTLARAAQMINDPRFREIPKNPAWAEQQTLDILKNFVDNPLWYENGEESRLLPDDSPINMTSRGMNSSTYIRQARKDFNVDLDARLRTRGLKSYTSTENRQRVLDRRGFETWIENTDEQDFANRIARTEKLFTDLVKELEEWDAIDAAKGPDEFGDWQGREEIRRKMDKVADTFAMYINTSNNAVEKALDQKASIQAIVALIAEQQENGDVPLEYVEKLRSLLTELETERDESPLSFDIARIQKRHAILKRTLKNFDILFEVQRFRGDAEDVELSELTVDDLSMRQDDFAQILFDAFFSQRDMPFPFPASMRKRFSGLVESISDEQRIEWRKKLDSRLDNELDADFQEDLIDMYPANGTTRPRDVPAPTWRKVRAAMSRARSSNFDGERAAAQEAAMRLLEKVRPDLANETFVRGIRSSTNMTEPKLKANLFQRPIRGSSPEIPRIPIGDHFLSTTVDKLRSLGHDIDEVDLLPTGRYGRILRALEINTSGGTRSIYTQDMFSDIEYGTVPKILLGDTDPVILTDLLTIAVEQARKNISIIKIDGHQVKKVLGPVDEEVADIIGDEVDIAMLRVQGAPTYEQIMDLAAAQKIEQFRLNKIFSTGKKVEPSKAYGAYYKTLNRLGKIKGSKVQFFLDDETTEIASFDQNKINTKDNPTRALELWKRLNSNNRRLGVIEKLTDLINVSSEYNSSTQVPTNDAIFGVMAEMVGFKYGNISLTRARQNLKDNQDILTAMTFAPTPAGQHIKNLMEANVETKRISLEILEKFGQRYVHLLRERGVSDEEIKEMLKSIKDEKGLTLDVIENDEPIRRGNGTILKQALDAYLRKKLGSSLVPQITDDDFMSLGLHEVGHFILGQAFTRHGEFVANAWGYFVHGQGFWKNFVQGQRGQERFDGYTIREKFGRKMTKQQLADWDAQDSGGGVFWDPITENRSPWLGITEQDRQQMLNDVASRINDSPDLTEVEKAEIENQMRGGDFFVHPITLRKERLPNEKQLQIATEMGIDHTSLQTDDNIVRTWELYEEMIPIPPRVFGWMRENGTKGLTFEKVAEARRKEFSTLIALMLDLMGNSPVFVGTETPEEMALTARAIQQKRDATKLQFGSIIEQINRIAKENPALQKEFADDLKRLK